MCAELAFSPHAPACGGLASLPVALACGETASLPVALACGEAASLPVALACGETASLPLALACGELAFLPGAPTYGRILLLLFGGAQEMRAAVWLVAVLILLGAALPLWAGPFSEVPRGHWAYGEYANLAALGLLGPEDASAVRADAQLTRFEFALAILDPLISIEEAASALRPDADDMALLRAVARALRLSPNSSEEEIARAATGLRRLRDEFGDELRTLNFDRQLSDRALQVLADADAVRAWRAEALAPPRGALALAEAEASPTGLRVPFARGTVALTLPSDGQLPGLLDSLALSAATANPVGLQPAGGADPAVADPRISRLRTAYEYGVGSALTLSLAYEEIARHGQGLEALDSASLASVGVGYQLTPSASVKLSYSLLEYANYVFDTPPRRDRVAETAVSIEF